MKKDMESHGIFVGKFCMNPVHGYSERVPVKEACQMQTKRQTAFLKNTVKKQINKGPSSHLTLAQRRNLVWKT